MRKKKGVASWALYTMISIGAALALGVITFIIINRFGF